MGKKNKSDVLIIGGGAAGLALALVLAETGLAVDVVDPQKPAPFSKTPVGGRTVALMNSSLNILKAANIWSRMEGLSAPLRVMRIVDDSVSGLAPVVSDFDSAAIGLAQYGFNLPAGPLRAALYEEAQKRRNITLHIPAKLESYSHEGAHITAVLEGGKEINTRLLVGADGRTSRVREIAGIKTWSKKYSQSAITCLINHSRSHQNIAHEFHRPGGPLAFVPLPGNQSSVVWVEKTEDANALMALSPEGFIATLQEASNDVLGGMTLEAAPECWPLSALRAKELTGPRMALMAEAAHVMSPITAQGLNLSLRDVAALAESIADALRLGLDIGSNAVLENYARRREVDIRSRMAGVDGMNSFVSTDILGVKQLRRAGLMALDKITPLKNFAMEQGLAPPVDKGRLARGETL